MTGTPAATQGTPSPRPGGVVRERFEPHELRDVLANYELGEVRGVREVSLGTPTSPKAVVDCARGTLLLKRRARGVDAPGLVAFSHEMVLGCARRGVCVPPLVGTRGQNNSMMQLGDRVYELFVFIEGNADPRNVVSSEQCGALLGELHGALDAVLEADRERLGKLGIPGEPMAIDPGRADRAGLDKDILGVVRGVLERAAAHAGGPARMVHGDWHPGNVIFRGDVPVAVCDFDNVRLGSGERELAQGLAQFSLVRGEAGEPAARWAAAADVERIAAHWTGYVRTNGAVPDAGRVVGLMPGVLMEEALGSSNPEIVWAVLRKAQWLEDRHAEIVARLAEAMGPGLVPD